MAVRGAFIGGSLRSSPNQAAPTSIELCAVNLRYVTWREKPSPTGIYSAW